MEQPPLWSPSVIRAGVDPRGGALQGEGSVDFSEFRRWWSLKKNGRPTIDQVMAHSCNPCGESLLQL